MAGQVCGMLNEIKPVAVILDELYNGAKEELRKLAEEAL